MKKLKCHCGAVQAEIGITDNLEKILRCNCSICSVISLRSSKTFWHWVSSKLSDPQETSDIRQKTAIMRYLFFMIQK